MKAKKVLKIVAFLLIFVTLFYCVQNVLIYCEARDQKRFSEFFENERENSLDAVFLGSSATYAFWNPPVAFSEYGIAVASLTNSSQPGFAAKFLIEEARKTQPDAVYIINITRMLARYEKQTQRIVACFPDSLNKLEMIDYLSDNAELTLEERMIHYLPIIQYHDRWDELTYLDFEPDPERFKCGSVYGSFLKKSTKFKSVVQDFETEADVSEIDMKGIQDLMDYLHEEEVESLFVIMPQAVDDEVQCGQQNIVKRILTESGFDVLDLREHIDEMKINYAVDFYNERHTNLHGSLKVTDFISRYLLEKYEFEDKLYDDDYADWAQAAKRYYKKIGDYLINTDYRYLNARENRK